MTKKCYDYIKVNTENMETIENLLDSFLGNAAKGIVPQPENANAACREIRKIVDRFLESFRDTDPAWILEGAEAGNIPATASATPTESAEAPAPTEPLKAYTSAKQAEEEILAEYESEEYESEEYESAAPPKISLAERLRTLDNSSHPICQLAKLNYEDVADCYDSYEDYLREKMGDAWHSFDEEEWGPDEEEWDLDEEAWGPDEEEWGPDQEDWDDTGWDGDEDPDADNGILPEDKTPGEQTKPKN